MKHLMVDLETMGSGVNSVITSIAAVQFDIDNGNIGREFYNKCTIQSGLDMGLEVEGSTIEWWLQQNESARIEMVTGGRIELTDALFNFTSFIKSVILCLNKTDKGSNVQVWGNSARFDFGILENAYRKADLSIPWNFRNERCLRTLVAFNPEIKNNAVFEGIKHNPIDDCKFQIKYCVDIWNSLKK